MICEQDEPTVHEMVKNGIVGGAIPRSGELVVLAIAVEFTLLFFVILLLESNPKGFDVTIIDLNGR
jgi:hypothetical protein